MPKLILRRRKVVIFLILLLITQLVIFLNLKHSGTVSIATRIKLISTESSSLNLEEFHSLPDSNYDAVIYTKGLDSGNDLDDIFDIVDSILFFPLTTTEEASNYLSISPDKALFKYTNLEFKIAQNIDDSFYVNIVYNSKKSALEIIKPGIKISVSNKVILIPDKIYSSIIGVAEGSVIDINGTLIEVTEQMNIPFKYSVLKNSEIVLYEMKEEISLESFENELWQDQPTDCSNTMSGEPQMNISRVQDSTEGEYSMKLASSNHYACAFQTFPVSLDNSKIYKLGFDYKNLSGGTVMYYYKLQNGDMEESKSYSFTSNNTQWNSHQNFIKINDEKVGTTDSLNENSKLSIYFYAPSKGIGMINNQFDNVTLNKYIQSKIIRFDEISSLNKINDSSNFIIENFPVTITLLGGIESTPINLISGPSSSFENELWQDQPTDCSNTMSGEPQMNISRVQDSTEGEYSMKLASSNHYACAFQTFPVSLDNSKIYKLGFDYKNLSGGTVMYYYKLQNGDMEESKSYSFTSNSSSWNRQETLLSTDISQADTLIIGVYAPSNGSKNVSNLYDNFYLEEASKKDLNSLYIYYSNDSQNSDLNTSVISKTESDYELTTDKKSLMLISDDKFSEFYKLKIGKVYILNDKFHYKVNTNQNGWFLDPKTICAENNSLCIKNSDGDLSMHITIENDLIKYILASLLISGTTLAGCLIFLAYDGAKRWRLRRQKYHLDLRVKNPTPEGM